jgi:solute carrier family 6 amino acid transporter-like protein 5/7/9/14
MENIGDISDKLPTTTKSLIKFERGFSDPGPGQDINTIPVSLDGRRYVKNLSRVEIFHPNPKPEKSRVSVFRINSIVSDDGVQLEGDEPQRPQWDSPVEFLMSCISMSVGLGNVWRFPFTAYENGGGAFLIPYLLVLFLIGRPLYLLELGLGQFSSSGSVKVWDMIPAFYGVGYGQAVATCCVVSYYCSLIALSIYYLVVSCQSVLPWTICDPALLSENMTCVASRSIFNQSSSVCNNISSTCSSNNATRIISSAELYFKTGVLKENDDISAGLGMPDINLAVCLAICWILLYFTLKNGVSSSGKVAYFTAIFPYVVLIIFLIRGLTLPGASDGLLFFFTPQWDKLLEPGVWYAAVTQSFFSLSIGFGTLVTYSSFNPFTHNINRDALIISFADTGTSLLAGTVIFAILGNMAHELGVDVKDVVKSGTGLAFISYPEIIAKFDFCPQFFAVIFFLMLITLGLGSAVGLTSAVITVVSDALPSVNRHQIVKITCFSGFALGLVYVTPGGQTVLNLVDYFGGSLLILILAVIEVIAIAWVYGANKISSDFNFMLKTELSRYWTFCWGIFCPISLTIILFYALVTQTGLPMFLPVNSEQEEFLPAGA